MTTMTRKMIGMGSGFAPRGVVRLEGVFCEEAICTVLYSCKLGNVTPFNPTMPPIVITSHALPIRVHQ